MLSSFLAHNVDAAVQALACPFLETIASLLHYVVCEVAARRRRSQSCIPYRQPPTPNILGTVVRQVSKSGKLAEEFLTAPPCGPLSLRVPTSSTQPHGPGVPTSPGVHPDGLTSPASTAPGTTLVTARLSSLGGLAAGLAMQLEVGEDLDYGLILKLVRLVSYLAGAAPAHKEALQQHGVAGSLLGLLEECQLDPRMAVLPKSPTSPAAAPQTPPCKNSSNSSSAPASPTQTTAGASKNGTSSPKVSCEGVAGAGRSEVARQVADLLIETLWSLVRIVDDSPEGQKAVLLANGIPSLSGYVSYFPLPFTCAVTRRCTCCVCCRRNT
jgi:hypothetical protein